MLVVCTQDMVRSADNRKRKAATRRGDSFAAPDVCVREISESSTASALTSNPSSPNVQAYNENKNNNTTNIEETKSHPPKTRNPSQSSNNRSVAVSPDRASTRPTGGQNSGSVASSDLSSKNKTSFTGSRSVEENFSDSFPPNFHASPEGGHCVGPASSAISSPSESRAPTPSASAAGAPHSSSPLKVKKEEVREEEGGAQGCGSAASRGERRYSGAQEELAQQVSFELSPESSSSSRISAAFVMTPMKRREARNQQHQHLQDDHFYDNEDENYSYHNSHSPFYNSAPQEEENSHSASIAHKENIGGSAPITPFSKHHIRTISAMDEDRNHANQADTGSRSSAHDGPASSAEAPAGVHSAGLTNEKSRSATLREQPAVASSGRGHPLRPRPIRAGGVDAPHESPSASTAQHAASFAPPNEHRLASSYSGESDPYRRTLQPPSSMHHAGDPQHLYPYSGSFDQGDINHEPYEDFPPYGPPSHGRDYPLQQPPHHRPHHEDGVNVVSPPKDRVGHETMPPPQDPHAPPSWPSSHHGPTTEEDYLPPPGNSSSREADQFYQYPPSSPVRRSGRGGGPPSTPGGDDLSYGHLTPHRRPPTPPRRHGREMEQGEGGPEYEGNHHYAPHPDSGSDYEAREYAPPHSSSPMPPYRYSGRWDGYSSATKGTGEGQISTPSHNPGSGETMVSESFDSDHPHNSTPYRSSSASSTMVRVSDESTTASSHMTTPHSGSAAPHTPSSSGTYRYDRFGGGSWGRGYGNDVPPYMPHSSPSPYTPSSTSGRAPPGTPGYQADYGYSSDNKTPSEYGRDPLYHRDYIPPPPSSRQQGQSPYPMYDPYPPRYEHGGGYPPYPGYEESYHGPSRGSGDDYPRDDPEGAHSGYPPHRPYQHHPGGERYPPYMPSTGSYKRPNSPPPTSDSTPATSNGGTTSSANPALLALTGAAALQPPAAASEIDFDVTNPPSEPVMPPGTEPACASPSAVNTHDVLCGRGGGTNTQIGNRRFRALVHDFQPIYLMARRKEKPLIARSIVLIVRNRGGRFLKKDDNSGMLFEVGDEKAEAKTSQALREGLDVRATKSAANNILRQERNRKKKVSGSPPSPPQADPQVPVSARLPGLSKDDGSRDGPPSPRREVSHHPYEYQDPFRKRRRLPHGHSPGHFSSYGPDEGPHYHPHPPPQYHQPHGPPPVRQTLSEEDSMLLIDFSPPRAKMAREGHSQTPPRYASHHRHRHFHAHSGEAPHSPVREEPPYHPPHRMEEQQLTPTRSNTTQAEIQPAFGRVNNEENVPPSSQHQPQPSPSRRGASVKMEASEEVRGEGQPPEQGRIQLSPSKWSAV